VLFLCSPISKGSGYSHIKEIHTKDGKPVMNNSCEDEFFPLEIFTFQFMTMWITFEKDWFCLQSCHQLSANFSVTFLRTNKQTKRIPKTVQYRNSEACSHMIQYLLKPQSCQSLHRKLSPII